MSTSVPLQKWSTDVFFQNIIGMHGPWHTGVPTMLQSAPMYNLKISASFKILIILAYFNKIIKI